MLTIERLKEIQKFIKISPLAKAAGLKPTTMITKLRNTTQLDVKESLKMTNALKEAGIIITDIPTENKENA